MKVREYLKKHIWNDINFWRIQFIANIVIIIILILTILYLLGEYEYVVDELLKCMSLGD